MKNVFKFLSLGVLGMAFFAVSATSIFAQATLEECTPIYEKFKTERTSTDPQVLRAAIATGKDYLSKCSDLAGQEVVKTYITGQIPKIEAKITDIELKAIETRFNSAVQSKNMDEAFSSAKQLLGMNRPYALDLMLVVARIGYESATANPPVDKYNQDALTYAKMALQQLNEGKTSESYGAYQWSYKTTDCPDGKLNAIGWLNYTIGYISHARLKQSKEGIPFIYKSTQEGCATKNFAEGYRLIGVWFLDETIKLNNEYAALTKANGDKENDESLAKLAMVKGYAERALEAYARAYKIATAPNSKSPQAYKDALLKKVKEIYEVRYDDTAKVDAYIAEVSNKSFTDPSTPVTPVVLPPPTTTPTGAAPTKTSSLTSGGNDVADTTTAAASTTAKTAAPKTAATTTKKPAAKKPVAKKKGTR